MIFENQAEPASLINSTGNQAPVRSGKNPQNQVKLETGGKNGFCPSSVFKTMIFNLQSSWYLMSTMGIG